MEGGGKKGVERTASGKLKPTAAPFEPGKHSFAPMVPQVPHMMPMVHPMMVPVPVPVPEVGYASGHVPHNYGNEYVVLNDMPEAPEVDEPPLTPEAADAVLKQVEFYFSDANLATDEYLLKLVKRSSSGWVHLSVITTFKRISKYTSSIKNIASALQGSETLTVSGDGKAIRRKKPLPAVDPSEVAKRTVVAENLPRSSLSIDALTEMFSKCGTVKVVRILKPGEVKLPPQHSQPHGNHHGHHHGQEDLANHTVYSKQVHVQVEYSTQDEAAAACRTLTDDSSWRAGMKVRPLLLGGRIQKPRGGPEHEHHEQHQHQHQHQRHQHLKDGAARGGPSNDRRARSSSPVPIPTGKSKEKQQGRHSAASSFGDKHTAAAGSPEEIGGHIPKDAMEEAMQMAKKAVAGAAHNPEVAKARRRSLDARGRGGESQRHRGNGSGEHHLDAHSSRLGRNSNHGPGDTGPTGGDPVAIHAKHLQEEFANSDSGADTASSGGEDDAGKKKKGKRKSKSEYAKWASGAAAQQNSHPVPHHPGHHKVQEPRMPDGTRGFSMGRGKAMPPPPGL